MVTESWESLLHAAERQPPPKTCPQDAGHGSALSWNAMLRALGQQQQEQLASCKGFISSEHPHHYHGFPIPACSTARPANPPQEFLGTAGSAGTCTHAVLRGGVPGTVGGYCKQHSPPNQLKPPVHYGCHDSQQCSYLRHGCTCQDCKAQSDLPCRAPQTSRCTSRRVISAPDPPPRSLPGRGVFEICQESWKQGYRGLPGTEQMGPSGIRTSSNPLLEGQGFRERRLGRGEEGGSEPHGTPQDRYPHQQDWDGETSLASPRTAIRNLCQLKSTPAEKVSGTLRKNEKGAHRAADRGFCPAQESYHAPPANADPTRGITNCGEPNLAATRTLMQQSQTSAPLYDRHGTEEMTEQPHLWMGSLQHTTASIGQGPRASTNASQRATGCHNPNSYYPGQGLPSCLP
jgi:hypothetical protein